MIELVFLGVMSRFASWGLAPVVVTRPVAADDDVLREVLSDPVSQQRLLRGAGARADLRVKPSRSGCLITTELRIGGRTVAWLTWILTGAPGTTEVDLALQPESRGLGTRLALVLGGRRWIAHRLRATLATLAQTAAHVVEHAVAGSAADTPIPRRPQQRQLAVAGRPGAG